MSVKILGPLVKRISDANVTKIINQLTTHMNNMKKAELREISNIGLKGVIQEVDTVLGEKVADLLIPKLIAGLKEGSPAEVIQESLDILADLLARFGASLGKDLAQLKKSIMPHLESARQVTKKRATQCLTFVAKYAPEALFNELVDELIANLKSAKPMEKRTFIQALGSLARVVYHRMGKFIATISPLLLDAVKSSANAEDGDEDIKENVLQTYEAFVLRCPKDVSPELPNIIKLALRMLSFDPNFAGDDEDSSAGSGSDSDEGSFGGSDEDDDMDEDDESWKVRRAAAKTLSAIIVSHPELVELMWKDVAPTLIKRFTEREDSVRLDVLGAFNDLTRQTGNVSKGTGKAGVLNSLSSALPLILKPIGSQLKHKTSIKTRQGAVSVVREVALALPGCLAPHVDLLVPGLIVALSDKPQKNLQLKLEALSVLRVLLVTCPKGTFDKHLESFLPLVNSTSDAYFKIVSEGLRVSAALVLAAGAERSDFVIKVYSSIQPQMQANDIDQAVKEAAIAAAALVVATIGDKTPNLQDLLKTLADRLSNDVTCSAAVLAVGVIADAKVNIDSILTVTVQKLASFLRRVDRSLKTSSINSLNSLVGNYGDTAAFKGLHVTIVDELGRLVTEADLHLSQMALSLAARVLEAEPACARSVKEVLYPQAIRLIQSSLLQGNALESLTKLFAQLVRGKYESFSFKEILESLLKLAADGKLVKQNYISIGRCVSAIVLNAPNQADATATVNRFLSDVKADSDQAKLIALFCLGDIGRKSDLSSYTDLRDTLSKLLDQDNEEVRAAASYALGSIAVGNLTAFLPSILADIQVSKRQYLLLHSIREIIADAPAEALAPHLDVISNLLLDNSRSEDDGTRNVVAECLGKLVPVDPAKLVPELKKRLSDENAHTRATIVSGFKFAIGERMPANVEHALDAVMDDLLEKLNDAQVNVRRAALRTINFTIHNKPSLVRHRLTKHLPEMYDQTAIKKELIREVDLGPFKHRVDDGLETRKSAYECIYTMLERLPSVLSVSDLVQPIVGGLEDEQEIKLQCYLIIVRCTTVSSSQLLEVMDKLVDPIKKELKKKVDKNAIAQAQERQLELKRSALRAVAAMSKIQNADAKLKDLIETCITGTALKEQFDAISAESVIDQ